MDSSAFTVMPNLREAGLMGLFNVHVYQDIYERMAMKPDKYAIFSRYPASKVPQQMAESRLLFIHVPKNAGTSVKTALYSSDIGHATVRFYDFISPDMLSSKETFAIIRDPIDRFLSSYNFLINGGGEDIRIQERFVRILCKVHSVDDYLDYLEGLNGDWFKMDSFGRPQWWYLFDLKGNIRVKNLFVMGVHDRQMAAFLCGHTMRAVVPRNRTNKTTYSLTNGQRERVRRLYYQDIALVDLMTAVDGQAMLHSGLNVGQLARQTVI